MITLFGDEGAVWFAFCLVCGLYTVCHGWFAHTLGVIGRQCSSIVAIPEHPPYYFALKGKLKFPKII